MIEVERKFRPKENELKALLGDAQFMKEVLLHDLYYDYPDYHMFKNKIYLRNRNGNFELKIGDDEVTGTAEEIEEEENIKKYFKTEQPISEFIKDNLIQIIDYNTKRQKYKKGEFNIDVDELSFGYQCVEIELLVRDQPQVEEAHQKIIDLAKHYQLKIENIPAKRREYFRLLKPDIYKKFMAEETQRPKAVVGVLLLKEGKVLIGKRTATASHGPGEYAFPGGHIEDKESFKDAIERETLEESGVKIKNLKFLCVANIDKFKNHQAILVGMTADWESGEPRTLPKENIGNWAWYDLNNLPQPLFYPTEVVINSYKTGKNYYDKK